MCMATPTPASDGKVVVSFYSCNDAAGYTLDGDLLWTRGLNYDYPNASNSVGMSSSPIVVDGVAILMVENQADSFTIGLDANTGETKWELARPAEANWNSPITYKDKSGKTLVLLPSPGKLSAIDPATGKSSWDFTNCHPIASPSASAIPCSTGLARRVAGDQQGRQIIGAGGQMDVDAVVAEHTQPDRHGR